MLLFCCAGSEELWSEADSSCSGQPIHLWQFLRELLLKPHSYGRCIRWLNKEKGTVVVFTDTRSHAASPALSKTLSNIYWFSWKIRELIFLFSMKDKNSIDT